MTGHHTLTETEQAVTQRLGGLPLNFDAMAAVSNIYRASTAIRHHFEDSVLRKADLTWTGFVVLWVVWVWGEMEARHVAAEAGVTKGTLTGVAKTLEARGLIQRRSDPADGRVVRLRLSRAGERLIRQLFPEFNREESFVVAGLGAADCKALARILRQIIIQLEERGEARRTSIRGDGPALRRSGRRRKAAAS